MANEQKPTRLNQVAVVERMRKIDAILPDATREDITALIFATVERVVLTGGNLKDLQDSVSAAWNSRSAAKRSGLQ